MKLSVVLATRNEEENIERCLASVKKIADEIVIVDEESSDKTVFLAKKFGAKVFSVKHQPIFHKSKQKALVKAVGDWILQLDADEVVTKELAIEIKKVIKMDYGTLSKRKFSKSKEKLFDKHRAALEKRDGPIGEKTGEVVGFLIPRLNFFLGKPLKYAGNYPDGVIRLVKRGKAFFPQKSVHEQIILKGEVAWLANNLEHYDSPTISRYLERANRYTSLHADELKNKKVGKNPLKFLEFLLIKPLFFFCSLYIRHKGFLGGMRGFLWSLFSAFHYPISYFKYWTL